MKSADAARFWSKVLRGHGCWLWLGKSRPDGYGYFWPSRKKPVRAHRASWEISNGPIPAGMLVCHRCDVRNCVRPDHLFLGTQDDNVQDCLRKGRKRWVQAPHTPGQRHAMAKLTEDDAAALIALRTEGWTSKRLAEHFKISEGHARKIGVSKWRHLGPLAEWEAQRR
jgi:hypothetical protein